MPDRNSESDGFPEQQLPEAEAASEVSQFPTTPIRWSPDTNRLLKKITFTKITVCLLPGFRKKITFFFKYAKQNSSGRLKSNVANEQACPIHNYGHVRWA